MYRVAILIPTKNRYIFLERLLKYYINSKTDHVIYIGDASDRDYSNDILNLLEINKSNVLVKYFYLPGLNLRKTNTFLANNATEKYCSIICDDDFLITNSLTKCAQFLSENNDYRTAQGKAILFGLNESGPYGSIKGSQVYWKNNDIIDKTSLNRLSFFSNNYWVPQFSVHRTSEFISDSKFYQILTDESFGEIFHNFVFVANGKSKFIDCLYLIRQTHDNRYLLPDFYEWITSDNWHSDYKIFIDKLSNEIMITDNLSKEEAINIAKICLKNYLISFTKSSLKRTDVIKKGINNNFIKKLLLPFYLKYFYKDIFTKMINNKSKYQDDALEIYNLITNNSYVK